MHHNRIWGALLFNSIEFAAYYRNCLYIYWHIGGFSSLANPSLLLLPSHQSTFIIVLVINCGILLSRREMFNSVTHLLRQFTAVRLTLVYGRKVAFEHVLNETNFWCCQICKGCERFMAFLQEILGARCHYDMTPHRNRPKRT